MGFYNKKNEGKISLRLIAPRLENTVLDQGSWGKKIYSIRTVKFIFDN